MKEEAKKVQEVQAPEEKVETVALGHEELAKQIGIDVSMPPIFRGDPDRDPEKTKVEVADLMAVIDAERFTVTEMKNQLIIKNKKEKDIDKIQTWAWIDKSGRRSLFVKTPAKAGKHDLKPFHIDEVLARKKHLGRVRMVIPGVKRMEIVGAVIKDLFGKKKSSKK